MKLRKALFFCCLIPLLAVSCVERIDTPETVAGELVPVQLALSLEEGLPSTKAKVGSLTELKDSPAFRGMDSIWFLPFKVSSKVSATDKPLIAARPLPGISSTTHLYASSYAALPEGTQRVLVYGQGPRVSNAKTTDQEIKHRYGSLIADGLYRVDEKSTCGDIHFRPDPIFQSSSVNDDSRELAKIMDDIVKTSYKPNDSAEAVAWGETIDPTLQNYYVWMTGGGKLMPGSGKHVLIMVNTLYKYLKAYNNSSFNGLRDAILAKLSSHTSLTFNNDKDAFEYTDSNLKDYPVSQGVPEGSAYIRWDGNSFNPVKENETETLAPLSVFCYMPSLYYFVNTSIKTHENRDVEKEYAESKDWDKILKAYTQGTTVTHSTQAVALVDPLQYACCKGVFTIRAKTESLLDKDGKTVVIKDNAQEGTSYHFPVVGIIIASQFSQAFDFSPEAVGEEYFMYDKTFDEVPYLMDADKSKLPKLQTLVLPTPDGKDVYFCVEFRNDTDEAFTGADGVIYPGCCFYMTGKLEIGKTDKTGKFISQVFLQDSYSTVDCVVESLKNALVCVPDLRVPQFTLGITTVQNWETNKPTDSPLK
jgi:hypothetical protein